MSLYRKLHDGSRPLTLLGLSMLALLVMTTLMAFVDPTLVEGQPRWIKTMKFAASIAAYSFSLAWVLSHLPKRRLTRAISSVAAGAFVVEIVIITLQAARGKASHFNNETLLDAVLFGIMGAGIFVFFVANVIALVLAMRAELHDRVLAAGLRLGLLVGTIGAAEGALMTIPTAEQAAVLATGELPRRNGAHSVGVPDGGPGLRFFGWSTQGGDLRPAHFFGMHAFQVLPFFAAFLRRRRRLGEEQKVKLVETAAGVHLAVTVLLTVQALRAQPLLEPDPITLAMFGAIVLVGLGRALLITARFPALEAAR